MHHSPPKLGEALGGETKISYRPSPFCPSSNGERNPKTKSEDDAVGAPRLVFRRWGQDLMRRSATPRRQSAKPQWDVGSGPRSTSILKFEFVCLAMSQFGNEPV